MRKIIPVLLLLLIILCAGCTSYFSNLTTKRHTLAQNEQAVFEKEGNGFTTGIQKAEPRISSGLLTSLKVTITVKNTGLKPVSLMAYPRLEDPAGTQYPGNSLFLGTINPAGQVTAEGIIPVPGGKSPAELKDTLLYVRFQDTKLIPYEAAWSIDFQ